MTAKPRRVLVVACFDSFLRAGTELARRLEANGAEVGYAIVFARPSQISPAQYRALGFPRPLPTTTLEGLTQRNRLAQYDIIIVSLNGLRSRRFMSRFRRLWRPTDRRRPITVSLYPGLIFRFHREGWLSRMSCDLVLLNSPHDVREYDAMLRALGLSESNAMCGGLSFLPPLADIQPRTSGRDIVFVGQPTVPAASEEREFVVDQMIRLAAAYPDVPFVIKPRHRPNETTLHRVRHHFEDILSARRKAGGVPSNLRTSYESMASVLDDTRVCLTFSSTAALESLARGIPTRIITDLGVHENLGNHFFIGSGILCDFADVTPTLQSQVNREWLVDIAASGDDCFQEVERRLSELLQSQSKRGSALPEPSMRLFGRSSAYTSFVESRLGWQHLEALGGGKHNIAQRLRLAWAPVVRTVLAHLDR